MTEDISCVKIPWEYTEDGVKFQQDMAAYRELLMQTTKDLGYGCRNTIGLLDHEIGIWKGCYTPIGRAFAYLTRIDLGAKSAVLYFKAGNFDSARKFANLLCTKLNIKVELKESYGL